MPKYATRDIDFFNDLKVRTRIKEAGYDYSKLVYVPMAADIIHPGHINIIKTASKYGRVMVGLFTDDAIRTYKSEPYMNYDQRREVIENIKGVMYVVKQNSRDYSENLLHYKPE